MRWSGTLSDEEVLQSAGVCGFIPRAYTLLRQQKSGGVVGGDRGSLGVNVSQHYFGPTFTVLYPQHDATAWVTVHLMWRCSVLHDVYNSERVVMVSQGRQGDGGCGCLLRGIVPSHFVEKTVPKHVPL